LLVSEWPMRAGLQLLSYLRRLCLRVASAAVESRLCMSSGALPGPDLLRDCFLTRSKVPLLKLLP